MSYLGLPPTSAAFITDTFSGTGSQTDFTMSVAPASTTSMLVVAGGVLQDPANYAIIGMTLRFSTAPPSGTGNISVRYMGVPAASVVNTAYRTVTDMTASAGQTTFTVPGYTAGFIDVFRNGARLGAADFTATSGVSIVLAMAANANDLITTVSFSVQSVLNAIPNVPGAALANIGTAGIGQSYLASGVAGNGPAFLAYTSSTISFSGNTWATIAFGNKYFDTANCYDVTTGKFTPNVAGYYQFNLTIRFASAIAAGSYMGIAIYKSGNPSLPGSYGTLLQGSANTGGNSSVVESTIIYMNGTTDYVLPAAYSGNASNSVVADQSASSFSAFLARSA